MTESQRKAMDVRNSIGLMKNEDAQNNYGNHAAAIEVLEAYLAMAEPAPEPVAEVVDYILQDDIHNRLTPRVVDIAYSAFVLGGFDWFNDAKPMVMKQIAQIKKDLAEEAAPVRGPAPPPPAEVPILTQDDIVQIILSSKHLPLGDAIRLTEKVVRQKAGLK